VILILLHNKTIHSDNQYVEESIWIECSKNAPLNQKLEKKFFELFLVKRWSIFGAFEKKALREIPNFYCNVLIIRDARRGIRTPTPSLAGDFKSPVSTVPPSELGELGILHLFGDKVQLLK
jgi:hypothetical protein